MNYYLLSEQDLDELAWEIENFSLELRSRIQCKKVEEGPQNTSDKEPEEIGDES